MVQDLGFGSQIRVGRVFKEVWSCLGFFPNLPFYFIYFVDVDDSPIEPHLP